MNQSINEEVLNHINELRLQSQQQFINLKQIDPSLYTQLHSNDIVLQEYIYAYDHSLTQFIQYRFQIYPNLLILIKESAKEKIFTKLSLSNCTYKEESYQYEDKQLFGVKVLNQQGIMYYFFQTFGLRRDFVNAIKNFCMLMGFSAKYEIIQHIYQNIFECKKIDKNKFYNLKKFHIEEFQNSIVQEQVILNEIIISRSISHSGIQKIKGVYFENDTLFILYKEKIGIPLPKYLKNIDLDQIQIANLTYQLLQINKFLSIHNFYHGAINPCNIFIDPETDLIVLQNFYYLEGNKIEDANSFQANQFKMFVAPESIQNMSLGYQQDIFSIGVLLYIFSFELVFKNNEFDMNDKQQASSFFNKMEINFERISDVLNSFKDHKVKSIKNPQNMSFNQIELMIQLLEKDPNKRIKIQQAINNAWFLNLKQKIKQLTKSKKKPLPSLRTIVEIAQETDQLAQFSMTQLQRLSKQSLLLLESKNQIDLKQGKTYQSKNYFGSTLAQLIYEQDEKSSESSDDIDKIEEGNFLHFIMLRTQIKMIPSRRYHQKIFNMRL